MYCRKCGTEIEDDSIYCRKCGASVSETTESECKPLFSRENAVGATENVDLSRKSNTLKVNEDVTGRRRGVVVATEKKKHSFPIAIVIIIAIILLGIGGYFAMRESARADAQDAYNSVRSLTPGGASVFVVKKLGIHFYFQLRDGKLVSASRSAIPDEITGNQTIDIGNGDTVLLYWIYTDEEIKERTKLGVDGYNNRTVSVLNNALDWGNALKEDLSNVKKVRQRLREYGYGNDSFVPKTMEGEEGKYCFVWDKSTGYILMVRIEDNAVIIPELNAGETDIESWYCIDAEPQKKNCSDALYVKKYDKKA